MANQFAKTGGGVYREDGDGGCTVGTMRVVRAWCPRWVTVRRRALDTRLPSRRPHRFNERMMMQQPAQLESLQNY